MTRQFEHIELTKTDALMLRDLMRPFDDHLPEFIRGVLTRFCTKLYAALIELENKECINIPIDDDEALLINQKVANEDWDGAMSILRQSWAVLWEIKHGLPPATGLILEAFLQEMPILDGNKRA